MTPEKIANDNLTLEEKDFLTYVKSPELRPILLDRLQDLVLLSSFLLAESETSLTP